MEPEQEMLKQKLEKQEEYNKSMKKNMLTMRIILGCVVLLFFLPMGWLASNGGSTDLEDYNYEVTYEEYYY